MKTLSILKNALQLIADGTTDTHYPYRAAPRDVLMDFARDALRRYDASEGKAGKASPGVGKRKP